MSNMSRLPSTKSFLKLLIPFGHFPLPSAAPCYTFQKTSIHRHAGGFHFNSISISNKIRQSIAGRNISWHHSMQSMAGREEMISVPNEGGEAHLLEARVQCSGVIVDQFSEALLCFGAISVSIEDANFGEPHEQGLLDGPVPWELQKRAFWNQNCVTALFTAEKDVGECLALASDSIGLKEIPKYEVTKRECQDWIQQVQEIFQPTQVTDGLWVIPKWRTPPDPLAINITLDPGLAFGTGEHPTTRLCLLFLQECVKGEERVLDYGTGSGILGIAALKMGAGRAVAVDTDPMAVSSAIHNASLNSFGPDKMQVYLVPNDGSNAEASEGTKKRHLATTTSDTGPAQYDIVVANILLNPLLYLASHITGYIRPGGLVGLSGIILDQVPRVQECYSKFLDNISVSKDDGWACIKGTKKLIC